MPLPLTRVLRRIYHYAAYGVGAMVIVVCLVALTFRFWVMPRVADFVPLLEARASAALAQTVDIGQLQADWHGFAPRLIMSEVRVTPPQGEPLLLPRVEAVLSWLSLPLLEPRLASLTVVRPQLAMWRDRQGVILIAGIAVNHGEGDFADWLLRQHRVVIKDAQIHWRDALLDSPPLHFTSVRVLLENRFGRHRFGAIALPSEAASRLELRGDLRGRALRDRDSWSGTLYARVDAADFAAWGNWVPWAQRAVKTGFGTMRFWLTLDRGGVDSLTGDARLRDVAISISADLPDLAFASLRGDVGWSRQRGVDTLLVNDLRFQLPGAAPAEPASVQVSLTPDGKGGFQRVAGSARNLRLEALTALAGALPLPRQAHDLIEALNPVGLLDSADGHWAGVGDYAVKLRLSAAGARPYLDMPGFSGVSARIRADQNDGEVTLEGRASTLTWPRLFRHDLAFSAFDATADWKADARGVTLRFELPRLLNDDLQGMAEGRVELPKAGAPLLDMRARLTHGKASAVYRYLPHEVSQDAYAWLRQSLLGGHTDDVRMVLKGPLDRFPFDQGGGEFRVSVNTIDVTLQYAPDWPRLEGIRGRLLFHDKAMTMQANSARILETRIGPVKATIPDLFAGGAERLLVNGRAQGETRAFLDFIRHSPVDRHTDGLTAAMRAEGSGELTIRLDLPLHDLDASKVAGSYTFLDNRLAPGGDLPELTGVSGQISFTDTALSGRDIHARVLDFPALLTIDSQAGGVAVQLSGNADAAALQPYLPAALAQRLSGTTPWQAMIGLDSRGKSQLAVRADLAGLAIALPPPFDKPAGVPLPLSIQRRAGEDGVDTVQARLGNRLSLSARFPEVGPPWVHARLGDGDGDGEAAAPQQSGLTLSGGLRQFDADAWHRLDLTGGGADHLPLREAAIRVGDLRVLGRSWQDVQARLRPAGKGWRLQLDGRELAGEVVTLPESAGVRVLANFQHLRVPDPLPGDAGEAWTPPEAISRLELNVARLHWKNIDLGKMRVRLVPEQRGLRIENFAFDTPDGRLDGKGLLANHPRRPTHLELAVRSDDLGKLLARFGQPDRLRGGAARANGTLTWIGGIESFDLASLDGDIELTVGEGQFLKVEPGVARLLGIVSLQALPRRIALDFRDVFSEGFAFDEIVGRLHLQRGKAYTKDLRMNGPAAKVRMSGVIDLAGETQNLRLSIQPRLDDTVALAGALIGGPVVGLGTFIAGKVFNDPIGQAITFDYALTGTWNEPVATSVARSRQESAQQP